MQTILSTLSNAITTCVIVFKASCYHELFTYHLVHMCYKLPTARIKKIKNMSL